MIEYYSNEFKTVDAASSGKTMILRATRFPAQIGTFSDRSSKSQIGSNGRCPLRGGYKTEMDENR